MKTNKRLKQLAENILTSGMYDLYGIETRRKVLIMNLISIIGVSNLIPMGIIAFLRGNETLGYFDLAVATILVTNLIYLRKTKNFNFVSHTGISLVGCLFIYLFITGGVNNTGHLWYFTFPLFASFLLGYKKGAIATLIILAISILFLFTENNTHLLANYSRDFKIRFIPSFLVVFAYAQFFERLRQKTEEKLSEKNIYLSKTIDELKMAEKETKREKEKALRYLNIAGVILLALDRRGRVTLINKKGSDVLGTREREILGKDWFDNFLPFEKREDVREVFRKSISGQIALARYNENPILTRAGETKIIGWNNSVLRDESGQITGVLCSGEDLTYRKHTEGELLASKIAAEKANRAKSEFLANMSHELRTPLNHIIGFTELVLDKNFGELNNKQEEYLSDVHQSSIHLLLLINDILDLSKVEAGKIMMKFSNVNLRTLLENSQTMLKVKAMKKRIRLLTDLDGIPQKVRADEQKLKQVMYNLLSNAVKFTQDGGEVRILARPVKDNESRFSSFMKHGNTDFIIVSVQDNGIGIDFKDLDRIFEPFEQVDKLVGSSYQGTGLGLPLSKRFVELHDGMMLAESGGQGNGSTFSFVIPVQYVQHSQSFAQIY